MSLENILRNIKTNVKKTLVAGMISSMFLFSCAKNDSGPTQPNNPPPQQNRAPIITSSPPTQVDENSYYRYYISASDSDGDGINYSLIQKPNWLSISGDAVFGTSPEVSQDQGSNVEIRASDGKGGIAEQSWNLNVKNVYNVNVLPESQLNQISSINDNSITFSQPVNFSRSDIIVAGISNNTPYGFLREVTNVSVDRRTIQTSNATLEQAVKDGNFSYSGRLSPSGSPVSILKGIEQVSGADDFDFNLSLTNVVLFDLDGNPDTDYDQVLANGNISFNTSTTLDIGISNFTLNELVFKNSTNIKTDVSVGAGSIFVRKSDVKIAEYPFSPFVAGYIPTPIPIPVIIMPQLGVYVGIDPTRLNPLSVRVEQDANSDVGLIYRNREWSTISDFSNNFEFSNPVVNRDLEIRVYAGPSLEFMLYGIAGPFGSVGGRLRLNYENNSWELYGGYGASLGMRMEVFKKGVSLQFRDIINREWLLASGAGGGYGDGKILFVSTRDGNAEIYSMNTNGSDQRNLTNHSSKDYEPAWSPDGNKIVFVSDRDGNPEIYTMNLNGSSLTRLTSNNSTDRSPAWSPDGREIVFYSNRNDNSEFFLMNSEGTNQRKIEIPFGVHHYPKWFGSNEIVFSSTLAGERSFDIYKVNKDGTGLERLIATQFMDTKPSPSQDREHIAFVSNLEENYKIYIFDLSNRSFRDLPTGNEDSWHTSWGPDGRKLAYCYGGSIGEGTHELNSDIWIIDVYSLQNTRLTTRGPGNANFSPAWSPR